MFGSTESMAHGGGAKECCTPLSSGVTMGMVGTKFSLPCLIDPTFLQSRYNFHNLADSARVGIERVTGS